MDLPKQDEPWPPSLTVNASDGPSKIMTPEVDKEHALPLLALLPLPGSIERQPSATSGEDAAPCVRKSRSGRLQRPSAVILQASAAAEAKADERERDRASARVPALGGVVGAMAAFAARARTGSGRSWDGPAMGSRRSGLLADGLPPLPDVDPSADTATLARQLSAAVERVAARGASRVLALARVAAASASSDAAAAAARSAMAELKAARARLHALDAQASGEKETQMRLAKLLRNKQLAAAAAAVAASRPLRAQLLAAAEHVTRCASVEAAAGAAVDASDADGGHGEGSPACGGGGGGGGDGDAAGGADGDADMEECEELDDDAWGSDEEAAEAMASLRPEGYEGLFSRRGPQRFPRSPYGSALTEEAMRSVLHLSLGDAALACHMGTTQFKLQCRKLGVRRWPHRKLASVRGLLEWIEHTVSTRAAADEVLDKLGVWKSALEAIQLKALQEPLAELPEWVEKFRGWTIKHRSMEKRKVIRASAPLTFVPPPPGAFQTARI
jgi:hypothetical protein